MDSRYHRVNYGRYRSVQELDRRHYAIRAGMILSAVPTLSPSSARDSEPPLGASTIVYGLYINISLAQSRGARYKEIVN